MKLRFLLYLLSPAFALPCDGADFPSIVSLKAGEKVYVSMRLKGYTITGADFLFTPDKVMVKPLKTKPGDMVLTGEEKSQLDEYFVMIRNGAKRPPDQEGFDYSIKFFRNEQAIGEWTLQIYDARESGKPNLSLYALKDRIEKQQKDIEAVAPSEGDKPAR